MSKYSNQVPKWEFNRKSGAGLPINSEVGPSAGSDQRYTIGLDFGTSTTKTCFSSEKGHRRFAVVSHDSAPEGYSSMLFPSTVGLATDRLLFGYEAESAVNIPKVRSFKTCMLCQAGRRGAECGCDSRRLGHFNLSGKIISAEDLATLYLANVLKVAKKRVIESAGVGADGVRIHVNSAGPLDQLHEFGPLGAMFERTVFYAWRLADQSEKEWPVHEAMEALREVRCEVLPSREQSPTSIYPETHAAMMAYLELPQSEKGLHGLIDVGAGTTDIAFFWLQKDQNDTKAWYYAAGSRRVGMDDVDRALQGHLSASDGNLRRARERLSTSDLDRFRKMIKPVSLSIYRHQKSVLDVARRLDDRDWAWCENDVVGYKLFLVGGGAAFKPVARELTSRPPIGRSWRDQPEILKRLPDTTMVADRTGSKRRLRDADGNWAEPLLMLAYGLAHPRQDQVKYERDREGCRPLRRQQTDPIATGWLEEQLRNDERPKWV